MLITLILFSFGIGFGPHDMNQKNKLGLSVTQISQFSLYFKDMETNLFQVTVFSPNRETFSTNVSSSQRAQASALLPSLWVLSSYCKLRLNRVRWWATRPLKGNGISAVLRLRVCSRTWIVLFNGLFSDKIVLSPTAVPHRRLTPPKLFVFCTAAFCWWWI